MAKRTTKKRTTSTLSYPLELREAFGLLALENALESGAANSGKSALTASNGLGNDYELKFFPEAFTAMFLNGLRLAADYLRPAEEWLIRDIINLKRYDDPAQSMGLAMIVATYTTAAAENPDFTFETWVKSWFIDDRPTTTRNRSKGRGGRPKKGELSRSEAEFKRGQIENGADPDADEEDDDFFR